MINVIIADDQKIVREGLKMILSLDNEIKVIGEVDNGQDLIELLKKNIYPDVILMDIRMPIINGVDATKIIKEKFSHIKIIILTTFNVSGGTHTVLKATKKELSHLQLNCCSISLLFSNKILHLQFALYNHIFLG